MSQLKLQEIRNIRLEKAKKLREMGIDPYPAKSNKEISNSEILEKYEEYEGKEVTVAGRLMSWREHGQIAFGHIQDEKGRLQLFVQEKELENTNTEKQTLGFNNLNLLDIGDFVEAKGTVAKTSRGEISVIPHTIRILTKSLRPLPDKWEGLQDPELIYRKRYLDLVMNPERKEMFKRKSLFWQANRKFMEKNGFMEVETPILEHLTGGADARPFQTHHNALDEDFYLRISTELYQKRLIGGGFEKVYTLGPNFRNEGIDDEHLQEYYQIEWYWVYATYKENMNLVRDMFRFIAQKVYGKTQFTTRGLTYDLEDDWEEIDYVKVIRDKHGIDVFTATEDDMFSVIKKHGVELTGAINRIRLIDNLWKIIRKDIAGPAFLVHVPEFISPLAKRWPNDERLTERFQPIIAGSELGNGYSELNDPVDQYQRFLEQQKARDAGDDEAQMMDIDYVEMLEYGMPPTSGYGMSERVFWAFENVTAREATFFPQLRYKVDDTVAQIYPDFKVPRKATSKRKLVSEMDANCTISSPVKDMFEGISYAWVLIKGVDIKKFDKALEEKKRQVVNEQSHIEPEEIRNIPSIKSYREMIKETGMDPNRHIPSPEALLKRVVQGKGIYNINTGVDAYNLAVLETHIGLGGFDAAFVEFPVILRFSENGEEMRLLGDNGKVTKTKDGQLVYADKEKLLTLDLNYRDIERTKITEKTKDIILFADGGSGISKEDVRRALKKGAEYIQEFNGGEIGEYNLVE